MKVCQRKYLYHGIFSVRPVNTCEEKLYTYLKSTKHTTTANIKNICMIGAAIGGHGLDIC